MDEIVKQAMAKWPNVPDCYGWLGLDARGNWYMRDDQAQAAGPFAGGTIHSKGSQLRHERLIEFIERNYCADSQGRWIFQNGPQKVYVELELTPWIWRVDSDFSVRAHSGERAEVLACLVDELGRVYFDTNLGFGLVHSLDVAQVADALQAGIWVTQEVRSETLPTRYGYVQSPQRDSMGSSQH
jgi:hypothetical protein